MEYSAYDIKAAKPLRVSRGCEKHRTTRAKPIELAFSFGYSYTVDQRRDYLVLGQQTRGAEPGRMFRKVQGLARARLAARFDGNTQRNTNVMRYFVPSLLPKYKTVPSPAEYRANWEKR